MYDIINLSKIIKKLILIQKEVLIMKEQAIAKINTFGKAGVIITRVLKILMIIAIVFILAATIILAVLPNDIFKMSVSGKTDINIDLASVNKTLSQSEQEEINKSFQEEKEIININGYPYMLTSANASESEISITGTGKIETFSLHDVTFLLIMAMIDAALTLVVLFFTGSLCKAFAVCRSPFEENIIKSMNKVAVSLVFWGIAVSVSNMLITGILSGNYTFDGVNFSTIIAVLIIFALSYIFRYGAMLQQESDETL